MVLLILSGFVVGKIASKLLKPRASDASEDSTIVESNVLHEIINETITNIVVKNTSLTSQVATSVQSIALTVNGELKCGNNFIGEQRVSADVRYIENITQESVTEIKQETLATIKTKLDQDVDITRESSFSDLFSEMPDETKDSIITDVKNRIINSITQNISVTNLIESVNSVQVNQNIDLTINGIFDIGNDCIFSQDSIVKIQLDKVSRQIAESITAQGIEYEGEVDITQKVVKVKKGFSFFGGVIDMLILGLCCFLYPILFGVIGLKQGPTDSILGIVIGVVVGAGLFAILIGIYYTYYGHVPGQEPDCVDDETKCDPNSPECNVCESYRYRHPYRYSRWSAPYYYY